MIGLQHLKTVPKAVLNIRTDCEYRPLRFITCRKGWTFRSVFYRRTSLLFWVSQASCLHVTFYEAFTLFVTVVLANENDKKKEGNMKRIKEEERKWGRNGEMKGDNSRRCRAMVRDLRNSAKKPPANWWQSHSSFIFFYKALHCFKSSLLPAVKQAINIYLYIKFYTIITKVNF